MIDFYPLIEIARRVNKNLTDGYYNEELGVVGLKTTQDYYAFGEFNTRIMYVYFRFENQDILERDFANFVMEASLFCPTLVRVEKLVSSLNCTNSGKDFECTLKTDSSTSTS